MRRFWQRLLLAKWDVLGRKLLGPACIVIVAGMLVAGLWPFHAPKNQVTWISGGNGVRFGRHGTLLSSGRFPGPAGQDNGACSIELWLKPAVFDGSTLFSFYAPQSSRRFFLSQSISDLRLETDIRKGKFETRSIRFYVDDVLRPGRQTFVTITSGGGQTLIYIDGALAQTAPGYPLSNQDLKGELIVANLPRDSNSWTGVLRGLAFYGQKLTPAQVRRNFVAWTTSGEPQISGDERAEAIYLFNEHSGRVIHNHVPSGINLHIPDRYVVLDQEFLTPFWKEFDPTWNYAEDVLVNIAGFVPFGLVCCAYLSLVCQFKRPALAAVLLGFAISLTIEVLQSYLPTRDSGTTDLITNTFGTACGVWMCLAIPWRVVFAKVSQRLGPRNAGG